MFGDNAPTTVYCACHDVSGISFPFCQSVSTRVGQDSLACTSVFQITQTQRIFVKSGDAVQLMKWSPTTHKATSGQMELRETLSQNVAGGGGVGDMDQS